MNQLVPNNTVDIELENQRFQQRFKEFQESVARNKGSSIVKSNDQHSMDLGIELPIDVILPVSPTELKWREKHRPK